MIIYSLKYSFSYLEPVCCPMSSTNCCFLTCIQVSQEAGQVVWYSHLFQNFPEFIVVHIIKDFGIVNKAEVDDFLEIPCCFWWCNRCWQFDLWFLCLLLIQLEPWNFIFHILLKPILENFQHYFCSVGDDPITIVISNQVPSHISLDLFYLITKIDINSLVYFLFPS